MTQDAAGMLHFGSLQGVLTYDGAWWRTTELPNKSAVFSVAGGRGPETAVGAYGELGYITRDPHGSLNYRSLVPQLPPDFRDTGDVRSVCASGNGFLFVGERALIGWSGGAPRILADLRSTPKPPNRCATAGHATWLFGGDGLQRVDSQLVLLRGKRVESVIAFDDTRVIASVPGEGLYLIDGAAATPFAPEASAWLRDKTVVDGTRAGNRLMIGTRQHGVLILGIDGLIEQRLDVAANLPGDVLAGVLTDREGAVWLAYTGPIVRLDLATPVSLLDGRIGLHGSTTAVTRFSGRTYIATSHGLFALDGVAAREIPGMPAPVWSLQVIGDELLAGTGNGLYFIDKNDGVRRVADTEGVVVYEVLQSTADPDRIWVSARKGIGTMRREGGQWRFAGLLDGTPRYTRGLLERDGVLWAGSTFDGAVRLELPGQPDGSPSNVGQPLRLSLQTFGTGEVNVAEAGGVITAVRDSQFLLPRDGKLLPDTRLQHVSGDHFRFVQDARGNLWTNATPPQFIERRASSLFKSGTYGPAVPLVSIDTSNIQLVQADADGAIWFSGDDGLYRYDSSVRTSSRPQPRPMIQRAVDANGRIVTAPLPYSFRRLRVEFGPVSYQPGILYQYRLGDAETWSAWTAQPSIDYTNLDPGDHTFHVRARSGNGSVSPEASWRFTVLPPWYRTRGALLLWIVAAAALIALIVRLRTNALRRQAAKLRALVADRTEELQQANAHLERLSLLDELTGIANRRYFQRALIEDWRNALEEKQPLALIIIDLDHFKQLNDRHGHPAGDNALVQTARFLSRQIRRSGEMPARTSDIVARIGGEEFAILLANTTEEEAVYDAERLRAGIAALEGVPVTASCGVASIVPFEAEGWAALVERADRALYAAKAAGRNCVRAADEFIPREDAGSLRARTTIAQRDE